MELNRDNALTYLGEFKKDFRSGIGYVFDESGNISYQGDFSNGKIHGYGRAKYNDQSYYFGEWKENLRNGYVKLKI